MHQACAGDHFHKELVLLILCYGAYVFWEAYIAYWTTLNTSSLLHRQASANPTATVSMVPGYVLEEPSARYTRDNRWWHALVVTEGV